LTVALDVFIDFETEDNLLLFDTLELEIEQLNSYDLFSCWLEYRLFCEFILSYIFLFYLFICCSLFLRWLKKLLR